MQFLSDLVIFMRNVSDKTAYRNAYLVKSVSLAFTLVLFQSVYHMLAIYNVKANSRNFAPFLTPYETYLVQVISSRTGLNLSGKKHAANNFHQHVIPHCVFSFEFLHSTNN